MGRKDGKPRGKMTAYAFFVQTYREEHKKKHPDEQVVFAEFSRKCAEKWKGMGPKEKKRFDEMAAKDKIRYEKDMANYVPTGGVKGQGVKRKRKKDPNAPKRALSAFFFFCAEERVSVKKEYPSYGVGDTAKELGKRWETCPNKPKFDVLAKGDKVRYEKAMAAYKAGEGAPAPAPVAAKKSKVEKKAAAVVVEEDDDEDEEEDEEEEEEEDDASDDE